jgi:hypothetical protein
MTISSIKNLFTNIKTDDEKSIPEQKKYNKIIFEIEKNKINTKLEIDDFSDDSAEQLGLVLFLLNEGYYVQTLMDLITDLSNENNEKLKFAQKIINSWVEKINTSNSYEAKSEDEPLIKPTYFNNTK